MSRPISILDPYVLGGMNPPPPGISPLVMEPTMRLPEYGSVGLCQDPLSFSGAIGTIIAGSFEEAVHQFEDDDKGFSNFQDLSTRRFPTRRSMNRIYE